MSSLWLPPEPPKDPRKEYSKAHRCCPACGNESVSQTCMGYLVINENHRDENKASCSCGWTGIVHDLTDGSGNYEPMEVGGILSYYGGLLIKKENGIAYWRLESCEPTEWEKIPDSPWAELVRFEASRNKEQ